MPHLSEDIAPAMFTISGSVRYSGHSRSRIYIEIKAGNLDARKAGRRTLVTRASLDAMLDALPSINSEATRLSTPLASDVGTSPSFVSRTGLPQQATLDEASDHSGEFSDDR